ncbi:MAG: GNAT family N-acetyltransferase [Acidobacteriota bacterium]|nr:GNAT family N-acetyltransferase [Acidobacteriota bacterium]
MNIEDVTVVTDELVEELGRLMTQLSQSASPLTHEELQQIVDAEGIYLLVAKDSENVVGTLTLVLFRIPTGVRAWIEDVVVDELARGLGIGKALSRRALVLAKENGARTVDLTSRPSREAANHLYQRLGFKPRNTNVYRYLLESN